MSMLICKMFDAVRNSPTRSFFFIQPHRFSSSLASIDPTPNQHLFTVSYLMNSFGFPLEKAKRASKIFNFATPEKPDSVIAFFCNHGFTKTQASNLIMKVPQVLVFDTEKSLLPKLEFLKSKGISSTDVVKILSRTPTLLIRSLENQIIPSFEFIKNLIGSEERTLSAIKRRAGPLVVDLSRMAPNVEILRYVGVPDAKIAFLLTTQPRAFLPSREKFRQVVEEVKGMGLNPLRINFVLAVHVLLSMSKTVWEKKIQVYKNWGFSEDEILVTFGKSPWFMAVSEDKITKVMDFLVNKMGFESVLVLERPNVLSSSFEKRIVPRGLVCQALEVKGLIEKPNISISRRSKKNISISILTYPEILFVKMVVNLAKEEAPELLKLYEEKLALAR